jgi:hypothetical protein
MAAMPMLAGVGLMMVCCSSSSAAALMMGSEEDPGAGAGAGSGANDSGPACEEDLTITSHEGTLGACGSLDDIDPMEVTFQGAFFSPKSPVRGSEWIQELSSTTNKKEFIAHHQSSDNWCKMVRFELTKDGDNCNYKVVDTGYTTSPAASSTCTTKDSVLSHWGSKNSQSLAPTNTAHGYGIAQLKYNKYC